MNIILYLPWPPTVNSYYRAGHAGQRRISSNGRVYRSRAIDAIKQQVPLVSIDYRMYCEVVLFPPDRRDRDLDNYMKALLDAATHAGLWDDDSLIDQLAIYRGSVLKGGLVKLEIAHAGPIISSPMTQTV